MEENEKNNGSAIMGLMVSVKKTGYVARLE